MKTIEDWEQPQVGVHLVLAKMDVRWIIFECSTNIWIFECTTKWGRRLCKLLPFFILLPAEAGSLIIVRYCHLCFASLSRICLGWMYYKLSEDLVLYSAVFWLVGRMICAVYRELSKKQNRVFSLVSHWLGGGGEATWNFSPSPSLPVGQNRVMDRYSPPTNYWVNIKYQIRKSRSKLGLYSKSAILRAQHLFSFFVSSKPWKRSFLWEFCQYQANKIVIDKENWMRLVISQSWTLDSSMYQRNTLRLIQFCYRIFWLIPLCKTTVRQRLWSNFPSNSISQIALQWLARVTGHFCARATRTLDVEKRVSRSVYHRTCKSTSTVFIEHFFCHLLFILNVLHLVIFFQEWNSPYFAISLERQNSLLYMLSFDTLTDFTKRCCGSKTLRLHSFCPQVLVVCRHNKNLIWSAGGKNICLYLWRAPKKQKKELNSLLPASCQAVSRCATF